MTFEPDRLASSGAQRQGTVPIATLERLSAALAGTDGKADWQAHFEQYPDPGGATQTWLELVFSAPVSLSCAICTEPVAVTLSGCQRFRLVDDEDEAARLDEQAEDHDVLAARRRLDLRALLEDELILALPILPRHDTCPADGETAEAPETHQPFAGLAEKIAESGDRKRKTH